MFVGEAFRNEIGYWWVRASSIEILRIMRNRSHKQSHLRTSAGEYVGRDSTTYSERGYANDRNLIHLIHKLHHDCQYQLTQALAIFYR